jgi:hypothetical protein
MEIDSMDTKTLKKLLKEKTKSELVDFCKENNIKNYSGCSRSNIIKLIIEKNTAITEQPVSDDLSLSYNDEEYKVVLKPKVDFEGLNKELDNSGLTDPSTAPLQVPEEGAVKEKKTKKKSGKVKPTKLVKASGKDQPIANLVCSRCQKAVSDIHATQCCNKYCNATFQNV